MPKPQGFHLDPKKGWMWTWQNDKYTLLHASTNRGSATIDEVYPEGLANCVLVHDCWKPHFKTAVKTHQLCLVHLLRELEYFIEKRTNKWTYDFSNLLHKAIKLQQKLISKEYQKVDHLKSIQTIKHQQIQW